MPKYCRDVSEASKWGPGAKPLVGGSGGRSPPEADDIMTLETPTLALFFTVFLSFFVINCDIKTVANSTIMRAEDKIKKLERCDNVVVDQL